MNKTRFLKITLLLCFAMSLARARGEHPLVWDSMEKQVNPEGMNQLIEFSFAVTNTGVTDVVIRRTVSSCECTVPKIPATPWILKPGTGGELTARLNATGRFGKIVKHILIDSSHGPQMLTVISDIPHTPAPFNTSVRAKDRMMAQADRQAVFRGSCAACHAAPAAGLRGKELFAKACAICHISRHRAEMVPDLAALKHPGSEEYWRSIVTLGKAGTMMPAFGDAHGGILNQEQIDSLVAYLAEVYPAAKGESAVVH